MMAARASIVLERACGDDPKLTGGGLQRTRESSRLPFCFLLLSTVSAYRIARAIWAAWTTAYVHMKESS